MEQVLYRKYRPHTFADVQGQPHVVDVLRQAILSEKLAHAYLFTGPRGTGKTTTARLLAKAANCMNFAQHNDVCNACAMCLAHEAGTNIDLVEIDAASNRGIEEIRQLKENINYAPTAGKHKVYVIDEVHMLTKEAFNALLKTLEEPPRHVMFVMATTEPHKVPNTILSRVQRFDFRLASASELIDKLRKILAAEGVTADSAVLDTIYDYSEGSYRDAESLLGKLVADTSEPHISVARLNAVLGIPDSTLLRELVEQLLAKNRLRGLSIIESIDSKGVSWSQLTKEVINFLRATVLDKVEQGVGYNAELELLKRVLQLSNDLRQVSQAKILWEVLCLEGDSTGPVRVADPAPQPAPAPVSNPVQETMVEPEASNDSVGEEGVGQTADSVMMNIQQLNHALIAEVWPQLIGQIREQNSRLAMLLAGTATAVEQNKLLIKTKFKYNYTVLNQIENKHLISRLLSPKFGEVVVEIQLATDLPEVTKFSDAQQLPSNADLVESLF